jgi:SulP family sulfate permease
MPNRSDLLNYLLRPYSVFKDYQSANFRSDLLAGLSVGVVLLPQAIAFATIAQLPPAMGLYAAAVGAITGALWGSSAHVHTGPANTTSLLVASVLVSITPPGTMMYLLAAGMMAVMVGLFQLVLGMARLGVLVNFVSHSVIIGFAAGSGLLILIGQVRPLLGLPAVTGANLIETLYQTLLALPQLHLPTAAFGLGSLLVILLLSRWKPRLPGALISLAAAALVVFFIGQERLGITVLGGLPRSLPPLASLPVLDLDLIATLSTGALAVGAMGLIQAAAISRSISAVTRQKLDSNQEFVGQGLANFAAGIFSGFPVSASFARSAFVLQMGGRTPLAAVISGVFLLVVLLTLAPLTSYLPLAVFAAILILASIKLVDLREMRRIWRGARADAVIMLVTLFGTLFLRLDFAVLVGILLSFAIYIKNTSTPRVRPVVPDDNYRHLTFQPDKPLCPQLAIFDILGDLYFGAVHHVEVQVKRHLEQYPTQRYLLFRMQHVGHCDFSGIQLLEELVVTARQRGGDIYMVRVNEPIRRLMFATGFLNYLGADHILHQDEAIGHLFYRVLDPAICIYESNVRVFRECQSLARPESVVEIPTVEIPQAEVERIQPAQLWQELHQAEPPLVLDVREPREYRRGHIPGAELLPLPRLLADPQQVPREKSLVLVCRSGRRSQMAAEWLLACGCNKVRLLEGGTLAWENAGLLEAVESYAQPA